MYLLLIAILGFVAPIIGALASRHGPLTYIRPGRFLTFFGTGLLIAYLIASLIPGLEVTTTATLLLSIVGAVVVLGIVSDMFALYCIEAVRSGLLILSMSLGLTVGLFLIVGLERLSLENGATVLACVFGILITFYFLHKMPDPTETHSKAKDSSLYDSIKPPKDIKISSESSSVETKDTKEPEEKQKLGKTKKLKGEKKQKGVIKKRQKKGGQKR